MKRLSPSLVTVVLSFPAIYFAYRASNVFVIAVLLVAVQALLGFVFLMLRKRSLTLDGVRSGVAIIVLCVALYLNSEWPVWRTRIRFCLKGELPTQISDFKGYEDIWTDYVIKMDFKANPESIRKILHNGKFRLEEPRPSSEERVYLPVESVEQVYHRVTTDSAYSYMLIEYSAE